MKLLSLYKAGTIKKVLVAFGSVAATGAVIKYKSHSQGHLEGQPGFEDELAEGHGFAHFFQEALEVTTGSAREAGHSLRHMLVSLARAWEGRSVPAPGGGQRLSMPVALAEFLYSMAEDPEGGSRVGFVLAGYKVLDWLLDAAVAAPGTAEQAAVQRYLALVLADEEASCALLARPGALTKLLRLVEAEERQEQLEAPAARAAAAAAAAAKASPQQGLEGGVHGGEGGGGSRQLAGLVAELAHSGRLPVKPHQEDVQALLQMACQGSTPSASLLALQTLTGLARTSVLNCTAIAAAGAGRKLAELAARSASVVDVDGVQLELARLMTTLAANCPDHGDLHMVRWHYHLLCFAADAAANRNWPLAVASLGAFSSCLRAGSKLQDKLMRSNALPLLHQLTAQPVQAAPGMRAAIANAVGAMAEVRGTKFPQDEREYWTDMLLGWMGEQPLGAGTAQHSELLRALAGALSGLAMPAGPDGLHIAHAWLAEMIVYLSRQVEAARARKPAAKQAQQAGAGASSGSEGASASAGSWWKFWQSNGAAGSGDNSSSGRSQGAEVGMGPVEAVLAPVSEESSAAAELSAAADIRAVVPPPRPPSLQQWQQQQQPQAEGVAGSTGEGSDGVYLPPPPPPSTGPTTAAAAAAAAGQAGSHDGGSAAGTAGSWWWPFGGGSKGPAAEAGSKQQQGLGPRPTSDSELSEFLNAAPVGPLYARSVAVELLEASGRVGTYQEPPPDAEDLMSPDAIAKYAQVAAAIDMEVADKALCQALKVLCALVSGDLDKQRWLCQVGLLPLLHRLTIGHTQDIPEVTDPGYFNDALPLCVRRQAARLLAMVTADLEGARAVRKGGWVPWLQNIAVSSDCKVSSCAARALLHIESAAATVRHPPTLRGPAGLRPWAELKAIERSPPTLLPEPDPEGDVLEQAQAKLASVRRRIDRQLDAVRPPVPPERRLTMGDGVHLFDPLAPHHEVLAREGTASKSKDAPLVDIVFVHGIRGGAFATWRREGVLQRGQARENLERDTCWPGAWLAKELPQARLLSIEYPAPASGWEGESLPLTYTAVRLMDKLAAAGVGERPVIFVSHSMGGLVVKEILARAAHEQSERLHKLAQKARGAVFYSVPHFGAKLAAYGWQLRYVGGSPAAAVEQLRPGPHLDTINSCVKSMYKSGQLPVLSFSEGQQTRLGYVKTSIVPHESAFPGYGEFVVLPQHDHINVCKPVDTQDPAYARLAAFLHARVAEVKAELAEEADATMDHMEPAL